MNKIISNKLIKFRRFPKKENMSLVDSKIKISCNYTEKVKGKNYNFQPFEFFDYLESNKDLMYLRQDEIRTTREFEVKDRIRKINSKQIKNKYDN